VRLAGLAAALGGAALVLAFLGHPVGSGWIAILLSFGLLGRSLRWRSRLARKDETPGIKNNGVMFRGLTARGAIAWALGILFTAFYVALYFYEDLQARGMPRVLDGGIRLLHPLARFLSGHDADKWFLYGTLYTLAVLVMGVRMLAKYRHSRYQQLRTFSVMFFQLGFAFLVPSFLKLLQTPEYYFTYFWPLKPWYGYPDGVHSLATSGKFGLFCVAFGALMTLVATPLLTYKYGKRWYCSWVCGCGGLAETAGDPFRQNRTSRCARGGSSASVHGVLVLVDRDRDPVGELRPAGRVARRLVEPVREGLRPLHRIHLLGGRRRRFLPDPREPRVVPLRLSDGRDPRHLPTLLEPLPDHDERRSVHLLRQLLDLLRDGDRRALVRAAGGEHRARLLRRLRRVRGRLPARRPLARERRDARGPLPRGREAHRGIPELGRHPIGAPVRPAERPMEALDSPSAP
jgi:hypothetical protein